MEKLVPVELGSDSPYSYVGDLCRIVHAKLVNFNHLFGNEFGHRIIAINQTKRTQGKLERPVQQLEFIRVEPAAPQQAIDWHCPVPIRPKETPADWILPCAKQGATGALLRDVLQMNTRD
jgi:hypothetical protein